MKRSIKIAATTAAAVSSAMLVKKAKENKQNKVADPDKLFKNPGNVSYEDLKAYLEKQRIDRLKVH